MNRNAISLFSSSGIGDLGLKANGIKTVIANELLAERTKLFQNNYPDAKCFLGDIWELQEDIIEYYKANYDEAPFMILATPPLSRDVIKRHGQDAVRLSKRTTS